MPLLTGFLSALLDLAAPECCLLCGTGRGEATWCARGARAPGLRAVDAPHLCRACGDALVAAPLAGAAVAGCPPVWAARPTGADLVEVVGAWKYHRIRGLAWPLAGLLAPAAADLAGRLDRPAVLVPVPLHRRRRRQRGFDQAALLAHLVAGGLGWSVAPLLERRRGTAQQARLDDDRARRCNLAGSCRVRRGMVPPDGAPLVLVDDIVTSGATLAEAARALAAAGRPPVAALALGLRVGPG
ncbi:MAG: ComF family protein [Candidatus Krumholzibacteriia bacterium]